LVGSGQGSDSLPESTLRTVRRTPEVAESAGIVSSVFTLVDASGQASTDASAQVNVAGRSPNAPDLTDAQTVAGHNPRSRLEVSLQDSWADANHTRPGDRVRFATPSGVKRMPVVGLFKFPTGLD